jgi:RNA recognition motif-containing protein
VLPTSVFGPAGHGINAARVPNFHSLFDRVNPLGKLYVGNLPWRATDEDLKEFFSAFGTVQSASVVSDRDTGRSRGFGFVEMDDADVAKAIDGANGKDLGGRALRVSEARERAPRGPGGGGGGGRGPRGGSRY